MHCVDLRARLECSGVCEGNTAREMKLDGSPAGKPTNKIHKKQRKKKTKTNAVRHKKLKLTHLAADPKTGHVHTRRPRNLPRCRVRVRCVYVCVCGEGRVWTPRTESGTAAKASCEEIQNSWRRKGQQEEAPHCFRDGFQAGADSGGARNPLAGHDAAKGHEGSQTKAGFTRKKKKTQKARKPKHQIIAQRITRTATKKKRFNRGSMSDEDTLSARS